MHSQNAKAFQCLSAFKAKNFGNLLLLTYQNGTINIIDTLSGNITHITNTTYQSNCQTIWDEKRLLFYCYDSSNLIQFYEGSKMIMQFNLTIPNQAIKGISPIPELESLAFVVDHIVYLLNYSSINQKNESEIKLLANCCLLYTSDAADEEDSVDLGGRRIIKKKK
eukprot:TRINITY_DN1857_c0_g1_i4.p2 TRINITY_DN1857_c0_g1~~TRINITY_DN1857_c0_g1_i4.p2  ORF type:complete len:166 (+),score=30.50 TRINITY_DN1857_c0_g1_i4:522-1019(+)